MENSIDSSMTYDEPSRPLVGKDHTASDHTVVSKPDCLYGSQVIDVIMRKPEFSFLIRYYNLLYQCLIPNCKLTIKILKRLIKIPSDVESFIINGESLRIRCQRVINLLLVQLDATRDYKHFCYLFNMISVMPSITNKLRTEFHSHWYHYFQTGHDPMSYSTHNIHPTRLVPNSVNQLDTHAVDNIIIRCVDDGPSDDRADNYSISSHHQVIGRRCRIVTTTTTTAKATTVTSTTTVSSEVTSGGHHLHTNSTPVSTDVTFSVAESVSSLSSTSSGIDYAQQVSALHLMRSKYDVIVQSLPSDYEKTLQVVHGHLTDDQNCDVLTSPNYTIANKTILNCLMEKVKCTDDIVEFCNQLDKIISLLPDPGVLSSIVSELREAKQCVGKERTLPMKLTTQKDFAPLKTHYHAVLQLMPDNYEQSVGKLQNYISDDQICMILSSSNFTTANKTILDCLIEKMSRREELLDLCNQLETISTSHQLNILISEIRSELLNAVNSPSLVPTLPTTTTTNTSLPNIGISSSSGSHHPTILHQASNNSSERIRTTPVSSVSGDVSSLRAQLVHERSRLETGIRTPVPPPLPPNYVQREQLSIEMVTELCQSTIDPNSYGTSLTVTGAGGYGKTSVVTALCHHPVIKEQFKDGVVFIELGPQATDPSMKLSQLYHLLTGQYLKQGDINYAEQEINELTSLYCRNLLVIIDDVWHVEDAEPIVKAFSSCKIVLTTRMNGIDQYIPTKQVVSVGPMEQSEAISLLTCKVIDISQLSQEDQNLLDELAQDVHLWPLLLSLIRGQLSHYIKRYHSSQHQAIQTVQTKLHDNGLTAFDKNTIERSRKYAVKVCIEVTLELLTKSLSDKIKSFILWTGIGRRLQRAVLHNLWNITEHEALDITDMLWAYGLFQVTNVTIPPHNDTQQCVEVHAVISQYIIECMESSEVFTLSPFGTLGTSQSVANELKHLFQQSCGISDVTSLSAAKYLKYRKKEIENDLLSFYLTMLNMHMIIDPHFIANVLTRVKKGIMASQSILIFLPSICEQIDLLINDCHQAVKDVLKWSRKVNQSAQQCLTQNKYHTLIQTIELYVKNYPIGLIAQRAITTVMNIIPYCDGTLLHNLTMGCELLQMRTPEYNDRKLLVFPKIKFYIEQIEKINTSLLSGSSPIEQTYFYYMSGKELEECKQLNSQYLMKLQEVAPISAQCHASDYHSSLVKLGM
ncbi:uncharacterized protein [Dysidea avara]|uniref:uncharacterized protein isoform X2 n=1 Tax=Dysidea avara TaxID=196820 RepID=UPI00332EFDB1